MSQAYNLVNMILISFETLIKKERIANYLKGIWTTITLKNLHTNFQLHQVQVLARKLTCQKRSQQEEIQ